MKLWPFCELFYGREPVEVLCLQMQNQHGVNVGLVVWLCWHAAHERFIDVNLFHAVKEEVLDERQDVIVSLRKIRKSPSIRKLTDFKTISGHVLAAEILLEKAVLEQLESQFEVSKAPLDSHAFGLFDYLTECQVTEAKSVATFLYASAACIT